MANPIIVGTSAITAIGANRDRVSVRFQNTSTTQTLYFIRQLGTSPAIPSATNFEFSLSPASAVFDPNDAWIETNSTATFNVVASAAGGEVAIFETVKI
jgi:hypothetical protein